MPRKSNDDDDDYRRSSPDANTPIEGHKLGPHRDKFESFEEISQKIDLLDEKFDKVIKARPDYTDPPSLRWVDRHIGQAVRKAAKILLVGALTAAGGLAAGWAWRDCQARVMAGK